MSGNLKTERLLLCFRHSSSSGCVSRLCRLRCAKAALFLVWFQPVVKTIICQDTLRTSTRNALQQPEFVYSAGHAGGDEVRKRVFLQPFDTIKRSFCQDRLGTNIGKTQNRDAFSYRAQQLGALHARLEALHSTGKETPHFAPFIHEMHHFTKTGSGQT
jgi:hypothetical protein